MMKDPRRVLSPRVVNAHESGPAFEAAMQGAEVIPATWGDLASRIVEEGLAEPSVDSVCDYLQIGREELADPEITISSRRDVYKLRERVEKDSDGKFDDTHGKVANEFAEYMNERIADWAVEDGEVQGEKIQEQITAQVPDRFSDEYKEFENDFARLDETSLLCLKRDALYSGAQVPLIDFVKAVFVEFEGQRFFTNDELADCIDEMVQGVIQEYVIRDPEQVKVEDVVIGKDQIFEFMRETRYRFSVRKDEHARQKWSKLEPFLHAPSPYEYPLLGRSSS